MQGKLDASSITPLYLQLKNAILDAISHGEFSENTKIPTETELCDKYGISRITVRNAISELVEEGRLIKKQGKGTFVSPKKIVDRASDRLNFALVCKLNGVNVTNQVLVAETDKASQRVADGLMISPGDVVVHIDRLRFTDGEPFMIEHVYLPGKYAGILSHDLDKESLFDTLQAEYNLDLVANSDQYVFHKTLEFTSTTKAEEELLKTQAHAPLLLVREVIEGYLVTKQIIVGDKYSIVIS